jgi:hypothetical protein
MIDKDPHLPTQADLYGVAFALVNTTTPSSSKATYSLDPTVLTAIAPSRANATFHNSCISHQTSCH